MDSFVCSGAKLACSFGSAPSTLTPTPQSAPAQVENVQAANIMDYAPNTNVPSFGMCSSPSNPTVAAATAAAGGVLTPQACVPVIPAPWTPGDPTVLVYNNPALTPSCQCQCTWGGAITITSPS